jgi:arylsulfatase A-like enzyme
VLDLNPRLDFAHANIGKWHLGTNVDLGGTMAPNRMGWSHFAGAMSAQIMSFTNWMRVTDGITEPMTDYATTVNVDDASRWLDRQREGRPWLLWVAFNAPHAPFHLPPRSLVSTTLPGTAADIAARRSMYYRAAIEAMDREIGRLLRHPRIARDMPLIVFVGDNGTPGEVVEAPYNGTRAKWTVYQGGLHVPLCVGGGGVAGARRSDALINVVDLYATALDAAGAARDTWAAPDQPIDSVSFWPMLRDATAPPPRVTNFAEVIAGAGTAATNLGRAARDARYKLIRFNDGREALYDLIEDPRELSDLRTRVESDAVLRTHYATLTAVLDRHR